MDIHFISHSGKEIKRIQCLKLFLAKNPNFQRKILIFNKKIPIFNKKFKFLTKNPKIPTDISSSLDTTAPVKPTAATESKLAQAMKNRHSELRKTVCAQRPKPETDENEDNLAGMYRKNIDRNIHVKNVASRSWCELCKKPHTFLVVHYVRWHPDHEVPISRPSPKMAHQLRQQSHQFTQIKGKISGICLFCEEVKSMPKSKWAQHLIIHTGEKYYSCLACDTSFKNRCDHPNTCDGKLVNIYMANSECNIDGFMCKDCNYLQLNRSNMVKHLQYEHGFKGPEVKLHYEQLTLIREPPVAKSKRDVQK